MDEAGFAEAGGGVGAVAVVILELLGSLGGGFGVEFRAVFRDEEGGAAERAAEEVDGLGGGEDEGAGGGVVHGERGEDEKDEGGSWRGGNGTDWTDGTYGGWGLALTGGRSEGVSEHVGHAGVKGFGGDAEGAVRVRGDGVVLD